MNSFSDLHIQRKLSQGGFGSVFQGVIKKGPRKVMCAIKIIDNAHMDKGSKYLHEIDILKMIQSEKCFPKIYDIEENTLSKKIFIVHELLGPNLYEVIKRANFKDMKAIVLKNNFMVVDAIKCLFKLHSHGILHCDIKLANFCIPLNPAKKMRLYLIDFGLSSKAKDKQAFTVKGTLPYISPFILVHCSYNYIDDLISLFYSLAEVYIVLPWDGITSWDAVQELKLKTSFESLACATSNKALKYVGKYIDAFLSCNMIDYDKEIDYISLIKLLRN